MRIRLAAAAIAIASAVAVAPVLQAQSTPSQPAAKAKKSAAGIPDLSGIWDPDTKGIRISSWDSSDPFAAHPEQEPMKPWAAEKFKDVRPPFGARQTMENTNDPVQRYCDPPGVPRIYMYPWEITFIQTPKIVYILYEYTKIWRAIAMDRDHPKDPDTTWLEIPSESMKAMPWSSTPSASTTRPGWTRPGIPTATRCTSSNASAARATKSWN